MPEEVAICNTGPLIALAKINQLGLLQSLFPKVVLPAAVARELEEGGVYAAGAGIRTMAGFTVVECRSEPDALLKTELDRGEALVIQLALETTDAVVLLDEKRARRLAESVYHLNVMGTGGLLLRAKKRGLVTKVGPALDELRRVGYFLSDSLVAGVLKAAGE